MYYFELRDENYKLLAHDDGLKLGCSINNNNEYLIIGNDISSDANTSWTKGTLWDLSETWIKDASGKVISPWNLD